MKKAREKELKARGFKATSVEEFLGLTSDEVAIIELRLALSKALKQRRLKAKVSQAAFAKRLKTSQSRLAKMEAGDKSVSFDLLIKNLLKLGVDKKELADVVAS